MMFRFGKDEGAQPGVMAIPGQALLAHGMAALALCALMPVTAALAQEQAYSVTLLTSLHVRGPDVPANDPGGPPQGWPAARSPKAAPLFVRGENGDYLYTPFCISNCDWGILRVSPVPSQYQVEDLRAQLAPTGPRLQLPNGNVNPVGNLVQRPNGDLVGLIAPTTLPLYPYDPGDGEWAMRWRDDEASFGKGVAYKTRFDGSNPQVIASTVDQLVYPYGYQEVGPDGAVYGIDVGPGGNGRIFRITTDDALEIVHAFAPGPDGMTAVPNQFVFDGDGWLVGLLGYDRGRAWVPTARTAGDTPTGVLYRLRPDAPGSYQELHRFTLAQGELVTTHTQMETNWGDFNALLLAPDGWLYGTTSLAKCEMFRRPAFGGNGRSTDLSPLCGGGFVPTRAGDDRAFPYLDHAFPANGSVFRVRPDGASLQVLHRFGIADGVTPRGPLALSPDGRYVYGTTLAGGQTDEGVLYRIDRDAIRFDEEAGQVTQSGFSVMHHFRQVESGRLPTGLRAGADDMIYGVSFTGGGPWIDNFGRSYDSDDKGTMFAFGPTLGASVTLTITPPEIQEGQTAELTWTSHLARDCTASSRQGDWVGAQPDSGSITLQPAVGFYNYTLVCIDVQSGRQVSSAIRTLQVGTPDDLNDGNTERYGNGGAAGWLTLAMAALWMRRRQQRPHDNSCF